MQQVRGAIELTHGGRGTHNIEAATLRVTYWPDRNEPDLYAELVLQEVR